MYSLQDVLTNVSITAINVPGLGGIDSAYVHRVIMYRIEHIFICT